MLALLLSTALAAPALPLRAELVDRGRPDDGRGPVALLVETPGVGPAAFGPLVDALELAGLDVWTLHLPVPAQRTSAIVEEVVPSALAALPARPTLLVGHGFGGTLAALATLRLPADHRPDALALLGAPLATEGRRIFDWMADQHTSGAAVDLGALAARQPHWDDQPVVPLLLGPDAPRLGRLSGEMVDTYLAWCRGTLALDLAPLAGMPVWAAGGSEDHLAPVESIRPALADSHTFVRFGHAAMMPRPFDHTALLVRPRPARALARWAVGALAQAAR